MQAHTPAQVDRGDAVEPLGGFVGGVAGRDLDSRVVVRQVEAAEGVDGAVHGGGDLRFVGDVTGQGENPVSRVGKVLRRRGERGFVDVGEGDGRAGLGERAGRDQPHPGPCAGDEGDLAAEVVRGVHLVFSVQRSMVTRPAVASTSAPPSARRPRMTTPSARGALR
nr:hypothetical protein [Amycolatopsis vastitatis]